MEFNDPSTQTEFNGMMSIIFRLDGLWKYAHKSKAMKDEDQYFHSLQSIYFELVHHITKGRNKGENSVGLMDNEVIQAHLKRTDLCIQDICTIQEHKKKSQMVPYSCWKNLWIWHMELVALTQKSGLGLSYGKDPRFAMGN